MMIFFLGIAILEPDFGSQWGGSLITVLHLSGPQFETSDVITCYFDGIESSGSYLDDQHVICASPRLSKSGRVEFELVVQNKFRGFSNFYSGTN